MKKIILSAAILLAFGVIGCNSNSSDPRGVLMSFIDALAKKDIEGAKKYATKDSEAMLGMIQMGMSMAPKDAKDSSYDKNSMEFGDAKIEGDKATVPVKNKKTGEITNYTLKKEGGAWKVAFDKATMTQMGTDKIKEKGMDMNNGMDSAAKMLQDMNRMNDTTRSMQDTMH
ncbi:MAG: hypothetical protein JWO92_168 [Chitinophagaceae bacterium]|nr:hypothetical protein [Chitinophagaceae bacterium]